MYEYETRVLRHGRLNLGEGRLDLDRFQTTVDEMSGQGWRLMEVWFDQKFQAKGERDGHVLLFERERA